MKYLMVVLLLMLMPSVSAQQRHGDGLDDVLQHVPLATVLTLRVCGVGETPWPQLALTAVGSYALAAGTTWGLKHVVHERRPDNSDNRSFPSGHATFAFAGATLLRHEVGGRYPWVAVGGYGLATLVAVDRVCRDRHHWYDVATGATIGFAATELTYLLKRKWLKSKNVDLSLALQSLDVTISW
ncbi:MAG: phosphatase PAP2 family protein [Prevotella sp.]|nr:phosphatase PAP2 family protein [Prevotella sp.]